MLAFIILILRLSFVHKQKPTHITLIGLEVYIEVWDNRHGGKLDSNASDFMYLYITITCSSRCCEIHMHPSFPPFSCHGRSLWLSTVPHLAVFSCAHNVLRWVILAAC